MRAIIPTRGRRAGESHAVAWREVRVLPHEDGVNRRERRIGDGTVVDGVPTTAHAHRRGQEAPRSPVRTGLDARRGYAFTVRRKGS